MRQSTFRASVIAAFLSVCVWATFGSAPSLAQEKAKAEVREAWDEYVRAFSAGRADFIADRVFLTPASWLNEDGVSVSMTAGEVKARFESQLNALATENYQRTETKVANVCVLNDGAAILSGRFTRYRKDGSVLSELAGTYVFAKTPQGWRIVAQMRNSADRLLTCGR
jgi:hypothetical protein